MAVYRLSYTDLIEAFNSQTLGAIGPTRMLMGPETYAQFHTWMGSLTEGGIPFAHPEGGIWFHGASAKPGDVPEGQVVLIGGAHFVKLDNSDSVS